jgi:hypothetical protein
MGCIAPSDPQGVLADATSSSTTDHHAACTWCSNSSAAVAREARARDRPRWRARVRCARGVARPAGAKARVDDQHRAAPARRAEARRARALERGGRAAVAPDGEARTALPRLPRVDFGLPLLGAKRWQGANRPGRPTGVHAVAGAPGHPARRLLSAGRVRRRQEERDRVGHRQLRRLIAPSRMPANPPRGKGRRPRMRARSRM